MDLHFEFVDAKGDHWEVRECDDADDCVVITVDTNDNHGRKVGEDSFHIPLASIRKLELALASIRGAYIGIGKFPGQNAPAPD